MRVIPLTSLLSPWGRGSRSPKRDDSLSLELKGHLNTSLDGDWPGRCRSAPVEVFGIPAYNYIEVHILQLGGYRPGLSIGNGTVVQLHYRR